MTDIEFDDDLKPGYYLVPFPVDGSLPFMLDGAKYNRVDEPDDIDERIDLFQDLMRSVVDCTIYYVDCDDEIFTYSHVWTRRRVVGNKSVPLE